MRSVAELINLVQDGQVKTIEQAREIIAEEVEQRVRFSGQNPAETRSILLENIGYNSRYCSDGLADKILELYETEHPIFGKTHPESEEALNRTIQHSIQNQMKEREQLATKRNKT